MIKINFIGFVLFFNNSLFAGNYYFTDKELKSENLNHNEKNNPIFFSMNINIGLGSNPDAFSTISFLYGFKVRAIKIFQEINLMLKTEMQNFSSRGAQSINNALSMSVSKGNVVKVSDDGYVNIVGCGYWGQNDIIFRENRASLFVGRAFKKYSVGFMTCIASSIVEIFEDGSRLFVGSVKTNRALNQGAFKLSESLLIKIGPEISSIIIKDDELLHIDACAYVSVPLNRTVKGYSKELGHPTHLDAILSSSREIKENTSIGFEISCVMALMLSTKMQLHIESFVDLSAKTNTSTHKRGDQLYDAFGNTLILNKRIEIGIGFMYGFI